MAAMDDLRASAGRMRWLREVEKLRGVGRRRKGDDDEEEEEEEDEELVEVLLRGKAPWGFTLRGGTEHREPLVITKVEPGSVAAAARLQAADEMLSVNAVPLAGSRQEAICLVKGSHKTLALVVRRQKKIQLHDVSLLMFDADVSSSYFPYFSFYSPPIRPEMVDVASPRTMPSETEVHVARSFLTKILRSSMRKNRFKGKNDPGSRPHSWHSSKLTEEETEPAGREAPPAPDWQPKHEARPKELSTQGEQNSQRQLTSQFSSVNNMERLDRPSHPFPPARLSPTKYISGAEPLTGPAGKRDSAFSCFSNGSSPPVHDQSTPGRKGTSTENIFFKGLQSEGLQQAGRPRYHQPALGSGGWEEQPATRVSIAGRMSIGPVWQVPEKESQSPPPPPPPLRSDSFAATKVFPYPEGPSGPTKSLRRSIEKLTESNEQNGLRSHQGKTSDPRHGFKPLPAKDSLHPPHAATDHNHNQLHPNKLFSLSSNDVRQSHYTQVAAHQRQYSDESPFYLHTRSAPPAKTQSVGSYYRSLQDLPTNLFNRRQVRHSTASMTSCAANPHLEGWGHSRYYGPAGKHLAQAAELQARQGKAEGRRGETEKTHWVNSSEPGFSSSLKAKYPLPQSQMPYSENKERNGHSHLGNGLHPTSEHCNQSRSPEDAAKRAEGHSNDTKRHFSAHLSNEHKVSLSRQQDPWVPQEDQRISPLKTPLLHSLAQESRSLAERQPAALTMGVMSTQDTGDPMATGSGKVNRRSDRYATTLRKEIQQKRAQLQKSRSAATLTCDAEDEEVEEWRSTETSTSSGASFSNIYKDHLKEAQARVLQATSFQRRDLEPLGPEVPVVKTSNGRIRGRKRFPLAKRTHSFSEPDKIDKVGVELEPQRESFGERRRFFEAKPAFSRPVLRSSQSSNLNTDLGEISKVKENTSSAEPEEPHSSAEPDLLSPGYNQSLLEQQRLGTFAEYQATWNKQKKSPEAKTQGRYHSAENILDADAEEKVLCTHERSRSSPSADFYAQNLPSPWRDPGDQQSSYTTRGESETRLRLQPDRSPHSALSVPRNQGPAPGLSDHRTKSNTANPSQTTRSSGPRSHSPSPGSQHAAQPPQTKGLLPPPRPLLGPETTSSSQEFLAASQANPAALQPLSSCSSETQHHDTAPGSSAGPAPASSLHLSWTSPPDGSQGDVEPGQEKEQLPRPSSPRSSWTAPLSLPSADRVRSPSPQFAPLRLTDKPPAVKHDSTLRSENELKFAEGMDVNSPVRKVPVRIVHAESSSDRGGRAYLPPTGETCRPFEPSPYIPCLGATEHPVSSLFSAYIRQVTQDPGQASSQETDKEWSSAGVQRSEEDAKREELARDIMGKDKTLVDILNQSGRKTTMDLMEGLFPPEEQILEGAHQRRRTPTSCRPTTSSPRTTDRRGEEQDVSASASLVPSSSYYNTSAPKAELLIKMKDMQGQLEEQDSEDELDIDLASKKQELISSLARKLEVLREARQSLQDDVEDNETLGREVEVTVQRLCQPNQLDKFRMFVGDLDKVVSLLLSLSGRLARVENALNSLEDEAVPAEKRNLTEKRKLLMRQHEDAKELKENLDRRERLVSGIMEVHLDAESLDDYRHFVKMKSALIIEQRKLEDKIKLGEEQLKCLLDSLPLEQRPML